MEDKSKDMTESTKRTYGGSQGISWCRVLILTAGIWLLVWLLADGSSDNAIIEQFFCGRNTVVSKDTHGIDPAAFDCGTASACYTAGCKIQHIDFGV